MEIWQNLEKNATQIMIFPSHYMWAENNTISGNHIHSMKICQIIFIEDGKIMRRYKIEDSVDETKCMLY